MAETVIWTGEDGLAWRAELGIEDGRPCIERLSYTRDGREAELAHKLFPEFKVVTGIRKTTPASQRQSLIRSEEEFYEARWNTYADHPMSRRDEVKRAWAAFTATSISIEHTKAVTVAVFDGAKACSFSGRFQLSFFEGCNLIKAELVMSTDEESCAYLYWGGLDGFSYDKLFYRSLEREMVSEYPRRATFGEGFHEYEVRLDARHRTVALKQAQGSVAMFPPPHRFFWARQNENCVGYNYYRRDDDAGTVALGVRQNEDHEYKGNRWACYNAPAKTQQHMTFFLAVSADSAQQCYDLAMRYTGHDVFRPLPGYQRMLAHFHMATHIFYEQDPSVERAWEKLFKEVGCDIALLCDFWGDGEMNGTGKSRADDLDLYHEACRTHSTKDFLIVPGEEIAQLPEDPIPGVIPGHWMFMPSKPVLYSRHRDDDQPFAEQLPDGRTYYHWNTPEDVLEMCRRENCFIFMPHPETKANDGYPYCVKDEPWFSDPLYWGIGFRYLPADNSTLRQIDGRVSQVWNDMNNWSDVPKYCMGELDTYQKKMEWDIYGDMNVTYVKLDELPDAGDWTPLVEALKAGQCFVSGGEVLIEDSSIEPGKAAFTASWTFPLDFAEVTYSDGENVTNLTVNARDTKPFGKQEFSFDLPAGIKWARVAAWDMAGNGAFGQPVFL